MRRRETSLDPAVAAELESLEAALAGDPAAEPELVALVRDVQLQAPAMGPAFRAQLDERVASGFGRAASGRLGERGTARRPGRGRRRFAAFRDRPLLPALGFAGCLLAGLVAVLVATGGNGEDNASHGGGVSAVAPAARESGGAGAGSAGSAPSADLAAPSAKDQSTSSAQAAPSPSAPPATGGRHVERSTRLELTTSDVQKTADGIVRATQAAGGYVQLSQVRTGDGNGSATFVLRVPTAKLDDALASLSKLGHVRSMEQSANDITGQYDGAQARLADARAERRGLLRALAKATTAQEIASLKARIADNRRELNRRQSELNAVRRRANYATIQVDVTGRPHKQEPAPGGSWDPGDAAHDALRVLEVGAGVALIGLAVLVPLAVLGTAAGFAAGALRRRRREAALDAAAEPI
jgi:Domain of unknown function (DUF4349)